MIDDGDDGLDLVDAVVIPNPALLALAKSLLEEADIPFFIKNENAQTLFGWGQMGSGFNFIVGPPVVMVQASQVETVRELLAELLQESPARDEDESE